MNGCPCTYGPHVTLALHDGHCCYLPLTPEGHPRPPSEMPVWPEPLACGHDDSAAMPGRGPRKPLDGAA